MSHERKPYTGEYRSNVYGQEDTQCDIEYHIGEEGFEDLPVPKAPTSPQDDDGRPTNTHPEGAA